MSTRGWGIRLYINSRCLLLHTTGQHHFGHPHAFGVFDGNFWKTGFLHHLFHLLPLGPPPLWKEGEEKEEGGWRGSFLPAWGADDTGWPGGNRYTSGVGGWVVSYLALSNSMIFRGKSLSVNLYFCHMSLELNLDWKTILKWLPCPLVNFKKSFEGTIHKVSPSR